MVGRLDPRWENSGQVDRQEKREWDDWKELCAFDPHFLASVTLVLLKPPSGMFYIHLLLL